MKLTEDQLEKSSGYWAERLGNPRFKILSDEERKDPENKDIAFGEIALSVLIPKMDVSDETRKKFKKALRSLIRKEAENKRVHPDFPPSLTYIFIDVDYHPCGILQNALRAVDVDQMNPSAFPLKTRMWVKADGTVLVSDGYGETERNL